MQCKAGKKGGVIGTLGHPAPPMQSSLQGRQQRELISGDLFGAIKYRFPANKGVLLVICALERHRSIQASEVVRRAGVLSSDGKKFI
jgi:hypothetical protein